VRLIFSLVNFDVEDIGDLEVHPIQENQIPADHDMRVIRRRRREHPFEFGWAGLHFLLKPRR